MIKTTEYNGNQHLQPKYMNRLKIPHSERFDIMKKYLLLLMTIFLVSSCIQRKQLGYTRDGIQGYTHFKNKEPFAIYSDCHDTCFVKMVDLQAEQEAGYMVTIISQKKDFFFVRFDYPNIGQFWIKKGDIGLNIRGLVSDDEKNTSVPIYKKPCFKSPIVANINSPQHVPILNTKRNWVYIEAIVEDGNEIEGWLAPFNQCGNPYTTCP